jgi:hypothetical protein
MLAQGVRRDWTNWADRSNGSQVEIPPSDILLDCFGAVRFRCRIATY